MIPYWQKRLENGLQLLLQCEGQLKIILLFDFNLSLFYNILAKIDLFFLQTWAFSKNCVAGHILHSSCYIRGAIVSSIGWCRIVAGSSSYHGSGTIISGARPIAPRSPHTIDD